MVARIVIAGAGGFGREVYAWITGSPNFLREAETEEVVFINDELASVPVPAPVVSTITAFEPGPDDLLVCAIGSVAGRRSVVESLEARGSRFATFVHESAIVGDRVTLGEGVIVCPGAILTCDIVVDRHVHININASVGHDVQIGEFATISPSCNLMGASVVERDVFLGAAVTIIPHRKVSRGSVIGAGSIVVKDVEADVTAFGNPCVVRTRS